MYRFFGLPIAKRQILLFVVDLLLLLLAFYAAYIVRLHAHRPISLLYAVSEYTGATFFSVVSYLLAFYIFDLYNPQVGRNGQKDTVQLLIAVAFGAVLVTGFYFFLPSWRQGRKILLMNAGFAFLLGLAWRKLYGTALYSRRRKEPTLVIGAGWAAHALLEEFKRNEVRHPYEIVGLTDDDPAKRGKDILGYEVIGTRNDIGRLIEKHGVTTLIMAITHERHKDLLSAVLTQKMSGRRVMDMRSVYKDLAGKIPIYHVEDSWLIDERGFDSIYRPHVRQLRRLADVTISLLGLLLTCWLFPVIALLTKVTSRGPVLYRQERVGLNGEIFNVVKFRSMVHGAEAQTGAVWSQEGDKRVTLLGQFLRRTRLDELPQLANVLRGDMALIGPRPERPEFVSELAREIPYYHLRHTVKPGLTGWAQVNYRYGASKEDAIEKLQYDLYYIQEGSLVLDLVILLKTVGTLVLSRGS
jgi:sugar transferase (PEP-CTERM system associated)